MKGQNISKINQGGCNNNLLLYIFYAVISSIVILVVVWIATLIVKGN